MKLQVNTKAVTSFLKLNQHSIIFERKLSKPKINATAYLPQSAKILAQKYLNIANINNRKVILLAPQVYLFSYIYFQKKFFYNFDQQFTEKYKKRQTKSNTVNVRN